MPASPDSRVFEERFECFAHQCDVWRCRGRGIARNARSYSATVPRRQCTAMPSRMTPTTTPSMTIDCDFRSTLIGSNSSFSGNSHTCEPSWR